ALLRRGVFGFRVGRGDGGLVVVAPQERGEAVIEAFALLLPVNVFVSVYVPDLLTRGPAADQARPNRVRAHVPVLAFAVVFFAATSSSATRSRRRASAARAAVMRSCQVSYRRCSILAVRIAA